MAETSQKTPAYELLAQYAARVRPHREPRRPGLLRSHISYRSLSCSYVRCTFHHPTFVGRDAHYWAYAACCDGGHHFMHLAVCRYEPVSAEHNGWPTGRRKRTVDVAMLAVDAYLDVDQRVLRPSRADREHMPSPCHIGLPSEHGWHQVASIMSTRALTLGWSMGPSTCHAPKLVVPFFSAVCSRFAVCMSAKISLLRVELAGLRGLVWDSQAPRSVRVGPT